MAGKKSLLGISTIEGALKQLRGGEQFALCSADADLTSQILKRCALAFPSKRITLLNVCGNASASLALPAKATIDPSKSESFEESLKRFNSFIRKAGAESVLFVSLTGTLPRQLAGAKKLLDFQLALQRTISTKALVGVWFIHRESVSADFLAATKESVDYFLDVSSTGPVSIAQFLKAKGIIQPEFFRPKSLQLQPRSVHISDAIGDRETKRHKTAFEHSPEPVVLFDLAGYSELNKRMQEVLGYNEKELSSLKLSDIIVPHCYRGTLRSLLVMKKKGRLTFRTRVRRKSGREVDLEVSAATIGKSLFSAVCTEIANRIQAEHDAQNVKNEYQQFVTSLPYPYAVFINRKLSLRNVAFDALFPWIGSGAPSISDFFGRKNADLLKEIAEILERPSEHSTIRNREVLIPSERRTSVATEVSIASVHYNGKPALYCSFVDVTERRRVLDKAAATEEKFSSLIEASPEAISISLDGKFILLNKRFAGIFGYDSSMEILGKDAASVVSGRNARAEIREREESFAEGDGQPLQYDYVGIKKDGTKIFVEAVATRVFLDGNWGILTYHRDVTSRKLLEDDLDRKAKGIDALNKISDDVSGSATLDDIYQHGLNAAMKGTQFEVGALFVVDHQLATMNLLRHRGLGETIQTKLSSQNLDDGFARFFDKTHEPIIASVNDYPPYLHYRSLFEAEKYTTVAFLPLVVDVRLHAVMLLATTREKSLDENDRIVLSALARQLSVAVEKARLVEKALDADERFQATVEQISDVLYTLLPNGTFEYMSPNVETLVGYRPADFLTNASLWRTILHPDDRPTLSQRVSNQAHGQESFALEYRILPKGRATYIWLRDSVRYKRDAHGNLVSINGILRDITDSKKLSELGHPDPQAAHAEHETAKIFQSLPDGIAVFDSALTCIEWNRAMEHITGIAHDDAFRKNVHDIPFLSGELQNILGLSLENSSEISKDVECDLPHATQKSQLHFRALPWNGNHDARLGTIVIATNIAHLQELRQNVTESEETLRNVIDAMGDALLISDLDGQIWEVNREFTRLTGYERDDVRLSTFPYPWLLEEEMLQFIRWIAALNEKQHLHDLDMTWVHKDGRHVAVSLNTTLLKNMHGEPMAILNIARDITERRKLVVELEWKNKQFELLNKIISYANTTTDLDRIFATIAAEVHALVPYEGMSIAFIDDDQQLSPWHLAVPTESGETRRVDDLAVNATVIYDAVRSGKAVILKEGEDVDVKSQITIPLFVNEKALGAFSLLSSRVNAFTGDELGFLQPVADQIGAIIQRVRLFQRVTDDSIYIHHLLNSINNVVYTVDSKYRITEVNKAWSEFMIRQGMEKWAKEEQIIGQSFQVIAPDEEMWRHYKSVMDDLFARRLEYYSRDFEIPGNAHGIAYHLVINPMIINEKVVALVFTHTDITEINRTEAELKRRNRELLALNAIATSINKSLEVESVLRVAVEQLKEAFDAKVVAFYLLDEETRRLVLSGHWGMPANYAEALRSLDIETSLTGNVINTRKPIYIMDHLSDDQRLTELGRKMNAHLGLRSSGVIPLQAKGKVQGAFMINFSQSHAFTENEQQLLVLIGNQIGTAVENAKLYAEVQQQVNTLTTLYELGKGLTGVLDLDSMLKVVYREVTRALPVERFYYQAYFPEQNSLSLLGRTVSGIAEFYPAGMKVRGLEDWPNSIYQNVVSDGTAYMGSTTSPATDSIMAVPIKANDKVIGIISIVSSSPNIYKASHLRLLESIANLTGVAIGKALLYEDTLKKTSEIENRNKDLDDFTYVVSHDLKEPLISIEGYSKIVMKDYGTKLDAEGREYLGAVVQSTTRMKHLIDDLLTLSRLGRISEVHELVSVKNIIDEILHDLQFSLREKNVTVRVVGLMPTVQYSGTRLSMVFRNLISNAMKFNDKGSPSIEIGAREEENEYIFSVSDNGIGIEPQYFDRIFTIFQRLKRSEEFRGTGAGLTITKRIVELEGGRIWVTSIPGEGSTFNFTIKKSV